MSRYARLIPLLLLAGVLSAAATDGETGSAAETQTTIRVNCGGQVYTDAAGRRFEADREFKEGDVWGYIGGAVGGGDPTLAVEGTEDDELFRSERWGVREYRFHVAPGIYDVRMYFNEFYFKGARRRVFDILLNGREVVTGLDLAERAGLNRALEIVRTVSTEDGWIVLGVNETIDRAKFSAIAIEPATADSEPPPVPAGVVAYPRSGRVGLEWSAVEATDLQGYKVYRGLSAGEMRALTAAPMPNTYYVDTTVQEGKTYHYGVSAIDLFGNEGARSEPIVAAPAAKDGAQGAIGINVGGAACEDAKGRSFAADRAYTPAVGAGFTFPGVTREASVRGVAEPMRSYQDGSLGYRFDVPAGVYRATFGMIDPTSRRGGDRVFDVLINDLEALRDLDIAADYGASLPLEVTRVFRVRGDKGAAFRFRAKSGQPVCSFIHIAPVEPDAEAPAAPAVETVTARDEVVYLRWTPSVEEDVAGYRVERADGEGAEFVKVTTALLGRAEFVDHSVKNDRKYAYRVIAEDASGNASEPSATATAEPKFPTDDELLQLVSRAAFEYFLRECDPTTYLTKDKNVAPPISVASAGFGLSAMCIGSENGWISRVEAERRAYLMLRALNFRSDNKALGLFYHYVDGDGGRSGAAYEDLVSTVDSALLMWGAIAAGEYFGGRVKSEAGLMMARMNWKRFADANTKMIAMAYHPSTGRFDGLWDYYTDEAILITLLGVSAPNPEFRLDPEYFYTFKRERKTYKDIPEIVYTWPGALFTYTFAHCWVDFKTLGPDNPEAVGKPAELRVDWFENTKRACMANREFCKFLARRYKSYGENAWGLTASSGPDNRYTVCGSPPCGGAAEAGGGTLALYGAGMAVPFTPDTAIAALKHYYTMRGPDGKKLLWKDEFEGGYGLIDAFNVDKNFFSEEIHGINHGPMLLLIDNYRNGLLWKLCLKNERIQEGLRRVGFNVPAGE